ncbi:MAG: ParB N-terminal domain-containing protein [Spirochaetota bacterium]
MRDEISQPVDIPLDHINIKDESFKVSRPTQDDSLQKSISMSGILEPVLLLRNEEGYRIIFGHNRIKAAGRCQLEVVSARVIKQIALQPYMQGVAKKMYHDELGPCGKCRVLNILRVIFKADHHQLQNAANILNVPGVFVRNSKYVESIIGLPGKLQDYLDVKNAGFRVLTGLMSFPKPAVNFLTEIVQNTQMRLNYFREIVSMMDDILRRDGSLDDVLAVERDDSDDRRAREESLYRSIRNIRYPRYTEMKNRIDEIAAMLRQKGVTVNLPPYFEGDACTVSFVVRKGDDLSCAPLQPDVEVAELLDTMLELL